MPGLNLATDVTMLVTMKNWYRNSPSDQSMHGNRLCLQRLVSVVKFIAERGLAFRDDQIRWTTQKVFPKNFQNFFKHILKKMRCF